MAKQRHIVREDMAYGAAAPVAVAAGSPAWLAWLDEAPAFRYEGAAGSFGARRERAQRGGWYWRAYRRTGGQLRRAYLGKSADLTRERLAEVAAELADAGAGAAPARVAATQAPMPQVLETKVRRPSVRRLMVTRPALLGRLDDVLSHRLTIIGAPAGYGKTTLMAQWCQAVEAGGGQPAHQARVAWLSLDAADNDATRLWHYVVAVLQRAEPALAESAPAFHSLRPVTAEGLLTALINSLSAGLSEASVPLVLVLDDYQVITDQNIHDAVTLLVERLPDRMHLLLASRAEPPLPLARWRAAGYVSELRSYDLRFTAGESASLVRDVSGIALRDDQLAVLVDRTEGWAAGLHLAGLALRAAPAASRAPGVLEQLSGNHPFIFDYLVNDIVRRQPAPVQRFLLQTAILDRMCGELCDAVLGWDQAQWREAQALLLPDEPQARSQSLLELLERSNLFVVALDEERRWFRYHQLFADALRAQLQRSMPAAAPELHRRAMQWHMEQRAHDDHALAGVALDHALSAGLEEQAVSIVESAARETVWYRGEMRTVLRWIALLPEALLHDRPALQLARCWALLATLQFGALEERLRQGAQHAARAPGLYRTAHWDANVDAIRSFVARINGDQAQALLQGQRALAHLPDSQVIERHMVAINLESSYLALGDLRAAQEVHDALIARAGEEDDLPALVSRDGLLAAQASLLTCAGRLFEARDILWPMIQAHGASRRRARTMGEHVIGLIEWIELHYEWNELDVAERLASQTLESGQNWWNNDLLAAASYWLGRVYQARGDAERGARLVRQSRDLGRGYNVPQIVREIEVYEAADALAAGDSGPAELLVAGRGLECDQRPGPERFEEYELLARLAIAQGRADAALGLIGRLRTLAMEGEYTRRLMRVDIVWALALHACDRTDEALAPLLLALTLAEPGQHVRTFIDEGEPMRELLRALRRRFRSVQATPALQSYVERLLRAFDSPTPARPEPAPWPGHEQLTPRERDVLELLSSGASNQQIAEELVVTLHTVKKHVSSVLAKLGVASRTQAAARWRGGEL